MTHNATLTIDKKSHVTHGLVCVPNNNSERWQISIIKLYYNNIDTFVIIIFISILNAGKDKYIISILFIVNNVSWTLVNKFCHNNQNETCKFWGAVKCLLKPIYIASLKLNIRCRLAGTFVLPNVQCMPRNDRDPGHVNTTRPDLLTNMIVEQLESKAISLVYFEELA